MKFRVLGCSGGIGGRNVHTTSFLVDDDVLIDAGTGVMELSIAELIAIDHVFVTHTHLDHIAALPLMIDTVGERRSRPLTVHASADSLAALRAHIFNWHIWPDFSVIPCAERPMLQFVEMPPGHRHDLGRGRSIEALPAAHSVPAVGYLLASAHGSLAFSGDTAYCPGFWQALNARKDLVALIVECAFPNRDAALADKSRHFCPKSLAQALRDLAPCKAQLYISHLKPGDMALIMDEIRQEIGHLSPRVLHNELIIDC